VIKHNDMTPLEVLQRSRDLLLAHGWARGAAQEPDGRLCLTGAAQLALGLQPQGLNGFLQNIDVGEQVLHFLRQALPTPHQLVWAWNDTEARSFNEVLGVIDDAILLAKEAEAAE
jgi:hypothetical protein